jgi:biotin carboxyl carrier protein
VTRYRVTVDGRTYDVEVDDPRARPVIARVDGQVFRVDVQPGVQPPIDSAKPGGSSTSAPAVPAALFQSQPAPSLPAGQHVLTAPIPGTIAKLVAVVGQTVERGDALLTIEAMKMFNVIRSPRAGTIAAVHVAEGEHVTQGKPLVSFLQT